MRRTLTLKQDADEPDTSNEIQSTKTGGKTLDEMPTAV